jgi:TRAP transporter TAXI family solute receptor
MLVRFFLAVGFMMSVSALPAVSLEFEKNIMTGSSTGTYIEIGKDIAALFNTCGQTIIVNESAGSIENILGVRSRRHTQFGIVQSDVLEFLRQYATNDAAIQKSIKGVGIALPLYNEEIHVLARREISSLNDLNGKRVGVGRDRSGTNLTATLVLDAANVKPRESLKESAQQSMDALLSGSIDAFFYVAGAPATLFDTQDIDGSQFHLLPITQDAVLSKYTNVTLAANTYPWQRENVSIAAVKAVLMTDDYNAGRNDYHKKSCNAVSDLSHLVLKNLETLQASGHPKWSQINLFDVPPGWTVPDCVLAGMDQSYEMQCSTQTNQPQGSSNVNEYLRNLNNILNNN